MTTGPDWLNPLDEALDGRGPVLGALMTTYDAPDVDFLVSDLLPTWLGLRREPSDDPFEQKAFAAELHTALSERSRGISVFSSSTRDPSDRHWLWSLVNRYRVGARGACTQHAKLWMVHRDVGTGDHEGHQTLDVWVTSANLTGSAFREQLQAGWRCSVPLAGRSRRGMLASWGVLPAFLEELGAHSGSAAVKAIVPWIELLKRAVCPDGAQFVASVPGRHRRSTWGVHGLAAAVEGSGALAVDVLVPTVGVWNADKLAAWTKGLGAKPGRMTLAWLPGGHRWATNWCLPLESHRAFVDAGMRLAAMPDVEDANDFRSPFHSEHDVRDRRWSHAKTYWFRRGSRTQVLVTSANFSTSAWGLANGKNDDLYIRNFELGVLLRADRSPIPRMALLGDDVATSIAQDDEQPVGDEPWWHVTWDGRTITVERCASGDHAPPSTIWIKDAAGGRFSARVMWEADDTTARIEWGPDRPTPRLVSLSEDEDGPAAVVEDLRAPELARDEPLAPPDELSAEELATLRARILEERYGGRGPDDGDEPGPNGDPGAPNGAGAASDYGVPVLLEGRRLFGVVTRWADELRRASSEDRRAVVLRDGRALVRFWDDIAAGARPSSVAYRLAAEELDVRLGVVE